jgi:hypothetical protein
MNAMGREVRAVLAAAALVAGCGSAPPPYRIVFAAQPNPFVHTPRFAVAAIDFAGLTVHGEPEERWAARQDTDKLSIFERDKDAIAESFMKALVERAHERGFDVVAASAANAPPFVVRPAVRDLDPGLSSYADTKPSGIRMRVVVTGAGDKRLDEIEIAHAGGGNEAASGQQHLGGDAAAIGETTADYLAKRVGGVP